jgi:hypothetical protein
MKNAVFWDGPPCGSYKNQHFGGTYHLNVKRTANAVPGSQILFTLMMEAIRSSETPILKRATRRHIPEEGIHVVLN